MVTRWTFKKSFLKGNKNHCLMYTLVKFGLSTSRNEGSMEKFKNLHCRGIYELPLQLVNPWDTLLRERNVSI